MRSSQLGASSDRVGFELEEVDLFIQSGGAAIVTAACRQ